MLIRIEPFQCNLAIANPSATHFQCNLLLIRVQPTANPNQVFPPSETYGYR